MTRGRYTDYRIVTRKSDREVLTLAPRCINIRDGIASLSWPNSKCDVRYERVNTIASRRIDVSRIDETGKMCEHLGMTDSSMIKRRE